MPDTTQIHKAPVLGCDTNTQNMWILCAPNSVYLCFWVHLIDSTVVVGKIMSKNSGILDCANKQQCHQGRRSS